MVMLQRRTAPLLSIVGNKPNPLLQGRPSNVRPAHSIPSPATDASPVTSDDERAIGTQPPERGLDEVADDDDFQDIDAVQPTQNTLREGKHPTSRGRDDAVTLRQDPRSQNKTSQSSPPNEGKRKREPSPSPLDPWNLPDEGRWVFAPGSSQQKNTYSRRPLSSQPSTQLHGPAVKGPRPKPSSQASSNGVQFHAPPMLPFQTKLGKPAFVHPTTLQLDTRSPRQRFKPPPALADTALDISDDTGGSSSPLSSVRSSISSPSDIEIIQDSQAPHRARSRASTPMTSTNESTTASATVPCPMCKTPVDRAFLESFSNGQRLRSRQALRFCESHQQRAAEQQWATAQYPSIDWTNLDKRLSRFHDAMHAILDQRVPSTYRTQLADRIATGRANAALRDSLLAGGGEARHSLPGYYGSRGGRLMAEHTMRGFGGELRRIAAGDPIFRAVGVSGYVQAVLVPEMACRLVMEDLGVGIERAREVLVESAAVGELLNAEEEERVEEEEGEDRDEEAGVDELGDNGLEEGSQALDVETPPRRTAKEGRKKRRKEVDVIDID